MSLLIDIIVAARPNFMKAAPLYAELQKRPWCQLRLIHTGQHYDQSMAGDFLESLFPSQPDISLNIEGGRHGEHTGKVLIAYEEILLAKPSDLVIVCGDVNSTLACCLAAVKLHIPVAHLEAGLRSWDRSMPEEINRILTDSMADFLWTPSPDADENLSNEGIPDDRIHRVGNIMIDCLEMMRPIIESKPRPDCLPETLQNHAVVTLHRPSNVDDQETLGSICKALVAISKEIPLVFPLHPRTRQHLERWDLLKTLTKPEIYITRPLPYTQFMNLVMESRIVISDSGGIQEETTYLGIPCLTLRPNTERPITVTMGTNRLTTADQLLTDAKSALEAVTSTLKIPLWDGHCAPRIADHIEQVLVNKNPD